MEGQTRQLAAIMFTDIVGYVKLMGEDEERAFELLKKNRQVQGPIIEKYNGRWIKEIGDGVLASFTAVSDAVYCAGAIQKACEDESDLKLRIGIHEGEVVFEGNDVFGDGVNIASRLEPLAPIGGILVSESVHKNVLNKKGIETEFIREENLKNVKEPVRIYEVNVDRIRDPISSPKERNINQNSIAVLPFVNMSNDPDQEYFCEGLAEELLTVLAQIKNLKVASRTSAFAFKGKDQDITVIGEKLKVRNVLEGSVRKAGSRIRITAQLVDVQSGYHLWSEKYDRQMDDIFAIQDEIALAIADHLQVTFGVDTAESVLMPSTQNTQAYDSYLRGRFLLHRMDASAHEAFEHFQTAIKLDPEFASAHAGIGATLQALGDQGLVDPKEVSQKANEALDHALKLNPKLAEAHVTKAWISTFYDWDIVQAEKYYLQALRLDPNSDSAHIRYSAFLSWMLYKHDEATAEARKAVEINPNENFNHNILGVAFWVAGRYEESIAQLKHAITLDPSSFHNHYHLGLVLRLDKQFKEALEEHKIALKIAPQHPWSLAELGMCHAAIGNMQDANECFDQLLALSGKILCSVYLAFLCAALGNIDQAFDFLESAYSSREPFVALVHMHPNSDPMRSDPRFEDFVRKVGILPPEMKK